MFHNDEKHLCIKAICSELKKKGWYKIIFIRIEMLIQWANLINELSIRILP